MPRPNVLALRADRRQGIPDVLVLSADHVHSLERTVVERAVVAEGARIGRSAVAGDPCEDAELTVLGAHTVIEPGGACAPVPGQLDRL